MKSIEFIFPELTDIYGESFNMEYLKRCNSEINLINTSYSDKPLFVSGKADMVYLGCMTESNQERTLLKLKQYKNEIKQNIESGVVFLVTGNSIELFGNEIMGDCVLNEDKFKMEGLGIFDFTSARSMKRERMNSLFVGEFNGFTLMGHKSQFSESYGNFSNCFIDLQFGMGMNKGTKKEGIKVNHFFATYSLGPFLVVNPYFTKYILKLLGLSEHLCFEEDAIRAYNHRLSDVMNYYK